MARHGDPRRRVERDDGSLGLGQAGGPCLERNDTKRSAVSQRHKPEKDPPVERRRPLSDHRCTYQDAETGAPVAELIGPDDWPAIGPQPMRRGHWYRCRQNCGAFVFIPLRGEAIRLNLWPGATLDQAKGRLARWRRRFDDPLS